MGQILAVVRQLAVSVRYTRPLGYGADPGSGETQLAVSLWYTRPLGYGADPGSGETASS